MSIRNSLLRKRQRALARKIQASGTQADRFLLWTRGINKYGNPIYVPKKVSYEEFISSNTSI